MKTGIKKAKNIQNTVRVIDLIHIHSFHSWQKPFFYLSPDLTNICILSTNCVQKIMGKICSIGAFFESFNFSLYRTGA